MAEVLGLLGRVDPHARLELRVAGSSRSPRAAARRVHRLGEAGDRELLVAGEAERVGRFAVGVHAAAARPCRRGSSGGCARSDSAITARTPSRLAPFAAQSRDEPEPYSLPPSTTSGVPSCAYSMRRRRSPSPRRPAGAVTPPSVPGASWLRRRMLANVPRIITSWCRGASRGVEVARLDAVLDRRTCPRAGRLIEHGVEPRDFNSYGSRRGHHEVMMRGTFANIRLRNQLAPGTEGGVTKDGEELSIFDAAMAYAQEGTPLVVLGGKEYGSGSSRDWAAKGTACSASGRSISSRSSASTARTSSAWRAAPDVPRRRIGRLARRHRRGGRPRPGLAEP